MAFKHGSGPWQGYTEVEGKLLGDSGRAYFVELDGGRREWFPHSAASIETLKGGRVAVIMKPWVAREKGFA